MPRQKRTLKRSDGEGTISKRRNKAGEIIGFKGAVTIGTTGLGIPERRWVSGISEQEVRSKIEAIKTARDAGMLANSQNRTVADFLKMWLEHKEFDGTRLKTTVRYAQSVNGHVIPNLGAIKLDKLRPLDIETALRHIRRTVSAKEARRTRLTISMALNQAVRWEMLPRNVCLTVRPPTIPAEEQNETRFWTPAKARIFLEFMRPHRHYALFYTGLMTGLRPCELLGLRWRDTDLNTAMLHIEQDAVSVNGKMLIGPVKTRASRRQVTISADTVQVLEEHKSRQDLEKRNAQEGYKNLGLVFASEIGTITNYANLKRVLLESIAKIAMKSWQKEGMITITKAGIYTQYRTFLQTRPELKEHMPVNEIGLHGLRHTHASILIHRGMNAKVVADRLGHASVAFMLQHYAHLYDDQRRDAALSVTEFLGSDQEDSPDEDE
jgi:integrase